MAVIVNMNLENHLIFDEVMDAILGSLHVIL
jgi:hypothetical protein